MGNQVATPESGGNVPSVNLTGTGATASTNTTRTAAAPGAPSKSKCDIDIRTNLCFAQLPNFDHT